MTLRLKSIMLLIFALGLTSLSASAFADPTGEWRVSDGEGKVRIEPCGPDLLCGYVAVADPSQRDVRNPDRSKRDRPILGMEVLINLKKDPTGAWVGTSYNAEDGQTYIARLTQQGDDTLQVEGCAPGGASCGKETWARSK